MAGFECSLKNNILKVDSTWEKRFLVKFPFGEIPKIEAFKGLTTFDTYYTFLERCFNCQGYTIFPSINIISGS